MNIMFWISFLLALLSGQVYETEDSSISSDNLVPMEYHRLDWNCDFNGDVDMCWIDLTTGNTGP